MAESFAPGAVVSEVARRHDVSPQHLFAWHKAARAGALSLPAEAGPLFVPVVAELRHDREMPAAGSSGVITIEIGGAVVRAARGIDHRPRVAAGCSARREGRDMIATTGVKVLVATKPVDFRRGADGLAALVKEQLRHEPFSGTIFIFRSKRADRLTDLLQYETARH